MAASDGKVIIDTQLNNKGFNKGVQGLKGELGGLKSVVGKLGTMLAGAFAVGSIVKFGKECIDLGSDVQEVQNVVDTAFGDMAYKAEAFASTAITQFGMSTLAAKKTSSRFMAMARGMGVVPEAASDMAIALAGLSGDVASFYNIDQEEAAVKLAGVFTGESEALKSIGVVMTETNLEAYALSHGITKSYSAMSQAEKVALRYSFVMDTLGLAQGDFAKTSDSWANQTRILSMQWQEFMSILGQALITVFTPVVKVLNQIVSGLISVANAFNAAITALFGGTNNQVKETAASAEAVGGAISGAVDNQEDLTKETNKTAKAQQKTIAAFDEINKLSGGSSGKDSSADGAVGGMDTAAPQYEVVPEQTTAESSFGRIKTLLKEISAIFMSGFWKGFQNADFSGIKTSLGSIRESLAGIFTSPEVQTAAQGFVEAYVGYLGQITGSTVSIGKTIAENLLGGFSKYLEGNSGFIQTRLSEILGSGSGIATAAGNAWSAFANIFSTFASQNGQTLTGNIIGTFSNVGLGITALATRIGEDFITFLTKPIIDNQDILKTALDGLLGNFASITGDIKGLVDDLVGDVLTLYDEKISPYIATLTEVLSDWVEALVTGYNEHIKPVIDQFAEEFGVLVNEHLKPMFGKIMEFVGNVIDILDWLWKNILGPIVEWLIGIFCRSFGNVFSLVKDVVMIAVKFVSDQISRIFSIFNGIIDFITGVFTGDWKKAWEGIKKVFTGIINGIISGIETGVNLIITAINGLIGGIDCIVGVVGDVFGLDWNIPKIPKLNLPRLAQGAVIPPNKEFMAVLGDQKSGTNIETPLATMVQAFKQALGETGGGGAQTIILQIDGREFGRAVKKYGGTETQRVGVSLVGVRG